VPALEPLVGVRVVAEAEVIDALEALGTGATILRFAADEALVIGAGVTLDAPAIVEDETGFVAFTVDRDVLERHVEWRLPSMGGIGQGKVAGVPAKVAWLSDSHAWVVTQAAYAHELAERLGWR
jgi:hypothetical protein